jgi:hypothetical protein
MKTIFTVGILLLTISFGMRAQDDYTIRNKQGASALLFTLNGLSDLGAGNYMGGAGVSTFMSDDLALRLGLGFGSNTLTKNNPADEETTATSFSLSPGARYNLFNNTNVALYAGGQAMIGIGQVKNTAAGADVSTVSTTTLGAGLFAGAEWFAWKNLSLSLEYGLGFRHTADKLKNAAGVESDGPTSVDVTMGISTVNFTLGFYFN